MDSVQERYKIQKKITVQTYDIDYAGHVSNITYLRWLEDMRLQTLNEFYSFEKCLNDGFLPVLVSTNVNYKRAIKLFDNVVGIMWPNKIGKTSFALDANIFANDQLAMESSQVIVFLDKKTMRPIRLPSVFMEAFHPKLCAQNTEVK